MFVLINTTLQKGNFSGIGTCPENDIRALNFFNNICNQEEKSIEKLLARQQLRTKTINSNSWFIEIKKMLIKYNLQDLCSPAISVPKFQFLLRIVDISHLRHHTFLFE
jgi:hypothetical protein